MKAKVGERITLPATLEGNPEQHGVVLGVTEGTPEVYMVEVDFKDREMDNYDGLVEVDEWELDVQ